MKKLLLIFAFAISVSLAGNAEVKTTVFNVDMHCQNCLDRVKNNVAALGDGVQQVAPDLEKRQVAVTYDDQVTSDENIIKGFETLRFHATVSDGNLIDLQGDHCNSCAEKKEQKQNGCGDCDDK